jgi:predicted nucleic acid-binding protein
MKWFFADTSYWIALLNPADQLNKPALELKGAIGETPILTSEAVLTELLNYFCGYGADTRAHVVRVVRDILTDLQIEVVPHTTELFLSGLDFYEARLDKGYSLTDCFSMLMIRQRGNIRVLTNDKHFTQEGFERLL